MNDSFELNSVKDKFVAFYSNNKKRINVIVAVVVVVAGGIYYFKGVYMPSQEKAASKKFAEVFYYFKKDSINIVLNGDPSRNIVSAPSIADNYSSTLKGKEAAHIAGMAYLQKKEYQKALDYFDKTDARDNIIAPSIISMKAVCFSELGNVEEAAFLFEKAGMIAENDFSAAYLKKAGIHYEEIENWKSALRVYTVIDELYSTTPEGTSIQLDIARMKAKLGEYNP